MDLSGMRKKSLLGVKENNRKSSTRAPSPTKHKDCSDEKPKDRSKDKGTKESSEKACGRDQTPRRRGTSSGSSSRAWPSSSSSSGCRTSTGPSSGSSSSSASSRSGRSSISRSSRSSSSSGPSPSRRRHDHRRRSCSKSKPPQRDEKGGNGGAIPLPKPTSVHIGRLPRNVTQDHIMELVCTSGNMKTMDMPAERMHPRLPAGSACVELENDEAEKALKLVDGGHTDGREVTATAVLAPGLATPRRVSPPRRMLPPPPGWLRSLPRMRRRSRSPGRSTPTHFHPPTPGRLRSRSSSNSS
uniref:RRM domain-containing protein n=1 Tax=Myotis lucifugus TaxID=59463 RepID=G1PL93_MYOLU